MFQFFKMVFPVQGARGTRVTIQKYSPIRCLLAYEKKVENVEKIVGGEGGVTHPVPSAGLERD